MSTTETKTYAATLATTITTAPVCTKSPPPTRLSIAGGGMLLSSSSVPRTGSLAPSGSASGGKASGKAQAVTAATGAGQAASSMASSGSGQASGSNAPTGGMTSSGTGGSGPTGGQVAGSSQGSSQGSGGPPAGGPPAGGLPAGGPPNPGGLPNPPAQGVQVAPQGGQVPIANGALKGHPPEVFNGDQSKAKKFIKEFSLWKLCNLNNEALAIPFSRVAMALSYIKGPNVDDWVEGMTNEVYTMVHGDQTAGRVATHQPDDEDLWGYFANKFTDTFTDTAAYEQAYADLTKLEMKGLEADNYIATFERLIVQAGWDRTAYRSVEMFKKGILRKMVFTILQ